MLVSPRVLSSKMLTAGNSRHTVDVCFLICSNNRSGGSEVGDLSIVLYPFRPFIYSERIYFQFKTDLFHKREPRRHGT